MSSSSSIFQCFLCCKAFPNLKEEVDNESDKPLTYSSSDLYSNQENNCEHSGGTVKTNLLRISHYLKVPKNVFSEEEDLRVCRECTEISEKLGNLCALLEVTQMKVNYHLNLLNDKIIKKDQGSSQYQQVYRSIFQLTFHEKCTTNSRALNVNPVVQLTKCRFPKEPILNDQSDNCDDIIISDDEEESPITFSNICTTIVPNPNQPGQLLITDNYKGPNFEEDGLINKMFESSLENAGKSSPKEYHPRISCQYCPMTFGNKANRNRHVLGSHIRGPVNKSGAHVIKPCEFCGAMISSRNMSGHKKRVHGIVGLQRKKREGLTFKRCEYCGGVFEMGWNMRRHLKESKMCGEARAAKILKCPNCGRIFIKMSNLKRHIEERCVRRRDLDLNPPSKVDVEIGLGNCT